jgi:hypothetical protein
MAERLQRMMQQGGLNEGLGRNADAASEFDGQGGGPSEMRVFGRIFWAHLITTIWRQEG